MKIIPVIDLMRGRAVHARQGLRNTYQPLNTPLCPDSCPMAVAEAYLSLHPFETLYIADLDALSHNGSNSTVIDQITARFPTLDFWIDLGSNNLERYPQPKRRWQTVVGTESLDVDTFDALKKQNRQAYILSLDFTIDGLIGPVSIIQNTDGWPDRVIIMSLCHVGSQSGPDWARIEYFTSKWPSRRFIVAGGVQEQKDLSRLANLGIEGVLVASALHAGLIDPATLRLYS